MYWYVAKYQTHISQCYLMTSYCHVYCRLLPKLLVLLLTSTSSQNKHKRPRATKKG